MMDHLLTLGTSGALDGLLLRSGGFYQNDFTKPLLFLSEDALPTKAAAIQPAGFAMGSDERDRQLSWAGMALALHLLVPDTTIQYLVEC